MSWTTLPYQRVPAAERKGAGQPSLRYCSHGRPIEDPCDDCVDEALAREHHYGQRDNGPR